LGRSSRIYRTIRSPAGRSREAEDFTGQSPNIYSGKVKAAPCPTCHVTLDGATGVAFEGESSRMPMVGDISICGYCGTVSTFTEEGLRLAEQHEVDRASHKFLFKVPLIRPSSPYRSRGSH
jgi:hypothetical protein